MLKVGDFVYHEDLRTSSQVRKIEECYRLETPTTVHDSNWLYPKKENCESMIRPLNKEGFFNLICDTNTSLGERLNPGPYVKYFHIYYDSDEIEEEKIRFNKILTIKRRY